jgi:hypothetical protein
MERPLFRSKPRYAKTIREFVHDFGAATLMLDWDGEK